MKKILLTALATQSLIMTLSIQSHALDIVLAPIIVGDGNDLGIITENNFEVIADAENPIGILAGLVMLPFAILNESDKSIPVVKSEESLLKSGFTQNEINKYKNEYKNIIMPTLNFHFSGKKIDRDTLLHTLYSLNLTQSSYEIMGLK